MTRLFVVLGSLNAFLAVALGAFGAHGLKAQLNPDLVVIYHTGVQYHIFHALGLILIGILAFSLPPSPYLKAAGWLMLMGIILFSGSLYVLSITGIRILGAITPFGGASFLLAWILLAAAAWKAL
jgi:uncharacterized membrane protein YgdD (TMEM256/DUF423 family)